MHDPHDFMGSEDWQDDDEEPEFDPCDGCDLGIPERFDPGYSGDWTQLPRVCCECGNTFRLADSGRAPGPRESALDDYCYECLGELFERMAAEGRETEQIAKRLGMTMEEFLGLE